MILLAPGKFLGVSDKTDLTQQAIYAIADDQANHVLLADKTGLVQQTMVDSGGTTRSMPVVHPVDWSCRTPPCSTKGWYMDFPPAGLGRARQRRSAAAARHAGGHLERAA